MTPFGAVLTLRHLRALPCEAVFRKSNGKNFVTDNGNFIIDCTFGIIADPASLDLQIKMIPGVVETGLFSNGMVTAVLVGYPGGDVKSITGGRSRTQ